MGFKINRIYIENFKLIEKVQLNFEKSNLIVLDGPNGFGKTTIFDAIELAITGKISRIGNNQVIDGREGCNDILYLKNQNKNAVIKVNFENNEGEFTIVKVINVQKDYSTKDKKADNWDIFSTYLLDDFDSIYTSDDKVSLSKVKSLFEEEYLDRFYKLFYYIQQEDNTHFLKMKEKNRTEFLSILFDTSTEKKELNKIKKIKRKLDKTIRNINDQIKDEEQKLKNENEKIENQEYTDLVTKYSRLLPWTEDIKLWDKKKLIVDNEITRDKYEKELNNIIIFLKNSRDFFKTLENEKIKAIANKFDLLKSFIVTFDFLENYEKIKEEYLKQKKLKTIRSKLEKKEIKNIAKINFKNLIDILNIDLEYTEIENLISTIRNKSENFSEAYDIVNELNNMRENLFKKYNNGAEHISFNEESCPMCGYNWGKEQLLKQLDKQKDFLENYCNDKEKKIQNKIDSLFNNYLYEIIERINLYFKENKIINKDFYIQLKTNYEKKDKLIELEKNLNKYDIEYCDYINKEDNKIVDDLENKANSLKKMILNNQNPISSSYEQIKDDINFKRIYKEYFMQNKDKVDVIDEKSIKEKIKYINYVFYIGEKEKTKKLKESIDKLGKERDKLNNLRDNKVKPLINIYQSEIRKHHNEIIKNIEVPFYIFSGKIIQNYQKGLGIFLKEYEELKNIKFISDPESDHDAINYLSSGQLSALVISFTLALNKIYGNNELSSIMIDDPVQTMDDINMISLVEVLRNEFGNKQIILSTHENDVANYIKYKFSKYRLDAKQINVRKTLS